MQNIQLSRGSREGQGKRSQLGSPVGVCQVDVTEEENDVLGEASCGNKEPPDHPGEYHKILLEAHVKSLLVPGQGSLLQGPALCFRLLLAAP